MIVSRYLLVIVLALGFITVFPLQAISGKVPFFITNNSPSGMCIQIDGPWLRDIFTHPFPAGTQNLNFYTAKFNPLFCPNGKWSSANFLEISGEGTCDGTKEISQVNFCLIANSSGDEGVYLTINSDNSLSVDGAPVFPLNSCNSSSTQAHLGDDPKPAAPDRDTFSFEGLAGDEVTLRLEEDPSAGHIGEQATLILRDAIGGVSFEEGRSGALPLEIITTLPATGKYSIVVEQVISLGM